MSSTIEMNHICKRFGNTVALDDVSISFQSGQVNVLVGKNGSGKSTLIKILAGAVQMDSGEIIIDGEKMFINTPSDAFQHGIVTVYQETSLVPYLSVAENILLGRHIKKKSGLIDWEKTKNKAREILSKICSDIDVDARISELTVWQMQVVEIAKAMSFNPSVLILDEPTSALAQNETDKLFEVISNLKQHDVTILYITHRLQELAIIADAVTIMRDGVLRGNLSKEEINNARIVDMMFGQMAEKLVIDRGTVKAEAVLEARGLTRKPYYEDVSFKLYKGEILGIAGMLGSGRSELVRSIYGADPGGEGGVLVFGKEVTKRTPERMKALGIGFIPEDRKGEGLVLSMSCRMNLVLADLQRIAPKLFISKKIENALVEEQVNGLLIKLGDVNAPADSLSGGNQQKIVVGKWLCTQPKIIIFDEPTRGIDIQAKQQIYKIIQDLSHMGISTIIISSELEEIVENCHRIILLKRGRVANEYQNERVTSEALYEECMSE